MFLHNLLNVLVQIANKMGLQKKLLSHLRLPQSGGPGHLFIPPETGWPSYTPGHWVFILSPLMTCRAEVEVTVRPTIN
jgi:hypothetical protein